MTKGRNYLASNWERRLVAYRMTVYRGFRWKDSPRAQDYIKIEWTLQNIRYTRSTVERLKPTLGEVQAVEYRYSLRLDKIRKIMGWEKL